MSGWYGDLAFVMLCNMLVLWGKCHQSWRVVGRHFQLYNTFPRIPNWPWAWPVWNCTASYQFFVSVKKMGKRWTEGASDIVKATSTGEDPRATGGLRLVSNLSHPRVNKTKQHPQKVTLFEWYPQKKTKKEEKVAFVSKFFTGNFKKYTITHRKMFKGGPEPLEKEIHEILDSKREDRFSNHFLKWYKKRVRFIFRTCFGLVISVRACGHCESSRRSARR